ncbi:hypothetical protein [Paenibacillus pini]|uniref:Uncharacterized protein n=1 Tax=Paenibacillus pini JCM 16418 TaxID=1236976 RepID=W7YMM2_9BACL|nr:hypothetical protein [Paenibacillus pini]GAF08878.1 hypothetical protein JCM16418_2987 [Paenibacillus pini JCM 16418]
MNQATERIQDLLNASIQIIDHMEESGETASQVKQIKQMLQQQTAQLTNGSIQSLESLNPSLAQVLRVVNQLQQETEQKYSEATGNATEQFEAKEIEKQLQFPAAYHEKIDYKSLHKISLNLEEAQSLLSH